MSDDPRHERITVANDRGQRRAARPDLPVDDAPRAGAVLAHCFTCSKDLRALRLIADALARAGFAVLRLDFTSLGASEGSFQETSFSSNVADLLAGIAALREHVTGPPLLVGHSLGGAATLAAALRDLRRPLLLLHAPGDATVGIDQARQLFEAAHHPKSFMALDGADHLLTDPSDARYTGNVIAAWASRYVAR